MALSELARIAGEFQAELERVARNLAGTDDVRRGRRPAGIVEATRLDLVGFRRGSVILDVEPNDPQATLLPSLLDEALGTFLDGVEALAADPFAMPRGFDRAVVSGLKDLTGGLGRAVTTIRIDRPGRQPVVIDERVKAAVRTHLRRAYSDEVQVSGRLHMGDFGPSALRCRIDTPHGSVMCDFDAELRDDVLASMDRLVVARGRAERWPGAESIRVLHLEAVESVHEPASRSVADLVADQGVQPIGDARELVGEQIDDFDEYLAAIRSLRSG